MKIIYALLAGTLLSFASCKKEESTTAAAATKSTWTLGATTYTVSNFTNTGNTYYAYDAAGNGIAFSFEPYPTTAGSFAIINDRASLGPQQVKVFAFGAQSGSSYFATGSDNKSAAVAFEGSRIKITMPEVWMRQGDDSLKATANLDKL